ncbi:hypothetical protein VTH06DRAFT_3318 [Thermothelomyces fergusii]
MVNYRNAVASGEKATVTFRPILDRRRQSFRAERSMRAASKAATIHAVCMIGRSCRSHLRGAQGLPKIRFVQRRAAATRKRRV